MNIKPIVILIAGALISTSVPAQNKKDPFIKGKTEAVNTAAEIITIIVNPRGSVVAVDHKPAEKKLDVDKTPKYILVRNEAGKEISTVSLVPGKLKAGILIILDKEGKVESSSEKHINSPNKSYQLSKDFNEKEFNNRDLNGEFLNGKPLKFKNLTNLTKAEKQHLDDNMIRRYIGDIKVYDGHGKSFIKNFDTKKTK